MTKVLEGPLKLVENVILQQNAVTSLTLDVCRSTASVGLS